MASLFEGYSDATGVDTVDSSPTGSDCLDRGSSLSFRLWLGGELRSDMEGSAAASGFWSIENKFDLVVVEWVLDMGGSRFLGPVPFLPVKILPGPKDIVDVLLIFPNLVRSPAFGGWPAMDHPSGWGGSTASRLPSRRDSPRVILAFCLQEDSLPWASFSLAP